jgi:hypothetical protein
MATTARHMAPEARHMAPGARHGAEHAVHSIVPDGTKRRATGNFSQCWADAVTKARSWRPRHAAWRPRRTTWRPMRDTARNMPCILSFRMALNVGLRATFRNAGLMR